MNFDDEDGPQRPIGGGDSLDRKIAATPAPSLASKKNKTRTRRRPSSDPQAITIGDADVLCGRGKTSFNHPGNKKFRDLITNSIPEYNKSVSRLEKSLVVHSIVESIREPGGRFLKLDQATGQWQELDDRACREKVGHAVRDAATTTQTRREKKRQMQSHYGLGGPPTILPAAQGRLTSRHTEMKLDTPDPVSFHDMVHFSNFMAGNTAAGRTQASTFPMLEPPRPMAESIVPRDMNMPAPAQPQHPHLQSAQAQTQAQNHSYLSSEGANGTQSQQEHPHDEVGFMAHIDQVLGPMPPDHDHDPLAELLDLS